MYSNVAVIVQCTRDHESVDDIFVKCPTYNNLAIIKRPKSRRHWLNSIIKTATQAVRQIENDQVAYFYSVRGVDIDFCPTLFWRVIVTSTIKLH